MQSPSSFEWIDSPLKPGNFSNSTFSVTWNLEDLCFLGGVFVEFIGMVSLAAPATTPPGVAPCLNLFKAPAFGAPPRPPPTPVKPVDEFGSKLELAELLAAT